MKLFILLFFSWSALLVGCKENNETKIMQTKNFVYNDSAIANTTIDVSKLDYNNKISVWTLNGEPYSGYAVSFYLDSVLKEKLCILNGKKEKESIKWFADGHFQETANFQKGKLHGKKNVWHENANHVLISQFNFKLGKPNGEQKQWYSTGEIHKILHLNMGKESGIQQAYRENGDLYANYEAKNGRVFGLQRGTLCFGLKDENIQNEK